MSWCATAQALPAPVTHIVDTEGNPNVRELDEAITGTDAQLGPGFVYLPNTTATGACGIRSMADSILSKQVKDAERTLGLDVQLAILLATAPIGCDSLFYVPVANDVRGIGYANTDGVELFDDDPETKLEGLAFLNDFPYWEEQPDEFRTSFLHEVGHRWAARVSASRDGIDYPLTGRQGGHWSYFLDSNGSPLEGNRFESSAPFTTATPELRLEYSPLDLYLMGLIEPASVGPIRLLMNGTAEGTDCAGHLVSAISPPQICEPKAVEGQWVELGIEDVIRREGKRQASSVETNPSVTAAVFVFGSPSEPWSIASCERLTGVIKDRFADFAHATGERLYLENVVENGLTCDALTELTVPQEHFDVTGGCTFKSPSRSTRDASRFFVIGFFGLVLATRLRRRRWVA